MVSKVRIEDRECPLSTTLGYIGEWWTVLILHDCFDGFSKFDEFRENIGLSPSMLTTRLRTLVEEGLLERRPYQSRPVRHEYLLTEKGRSLRPVLIAMAAWANSQLAPDERSMILVDTETTEEADPVLIDRKTGQLIEAGSYKFTAGPSAGQEMRARYMRIHDET